MYYVDWHGFGKVGFHIGLTNTKCDENYEIRKS
jgi:hypothetical protein